MKEVSFERNRKIHDLWSLGRTIEEISLLTAIPRSTVGYYVKKFKKYKREGRAINYGTPDKEQPPVVGPLDSIMIKGSFLGRIIDMIKQEKFQELYYFLTSFKCLTEIIRYLKPTPEEQKLIDEALNSFKPKERRSIGEIVKS